MSLEGGREGGRDEGGREGRDIGERGREGREGGCPRLGREGGRDDLYTYRYVQFFFYIATFYS